jgi:hypothetical protein
MRVYSCIALAVVIAGCDDGPKQFFTPNKGNPVAQNGFKYTPPFTQSGEKRYDTGSAGGDSSGRARFCDEDAREVVINGMVTQPILPDVGLAGMTLWSKEGGSVHANDLMGKPAEGKFCDPTGVYSDGLSWGALEEIVVIINQETKLVESMYAVAGYKGSLSGKVAGADGVEAQVVIKPRDQVKIGTKLLTDYASSTDQASKPASFLNHQNITQLYGMIRQSFFGAPKLEAGYNCVEAHLCDVIYTGEDESVPQFTNVLFRDSGVALGFSPEGHITFINVEPVRVAPFELDSALAFTGDDGLIAPAVESMSLPGCSISLANDLTFAEFKAACVKDSRTLNRATYSVHTQRDAVSVAFNGVTLDFLRTIARGEVFKDGEAPTGPEKLYGISFTRSLNAPVIEYVPAALGPAYKAKLEARLKALVASDANHPFNTFAVTLPQGLSTDPQPIGEIKYQLPTGQMASLVPAVVAQVQNRYASLTNGQKNRASEVLRTAFLVEPFLEAVLDALTGGAASKPGAFTAFRGSDDKRWVSGLTHFLKNGEPYRMEIQYSLNYGALTYVSVDRGYSQIDALYEKLNKGLRAPADTSPYYGIELARKPNNPFGLNGTGLRVTGSDRALGTVDISLGEKTLVAPEGPTAFTVPGVHIDARGGYRRMLRGERWEFIPAHEVTLLGKETWMTYWLENDPDGQVRIGRISQGTFKSALPLCRGAAPLSVRFGDDMKKVIDAWAKAHPTDYRDCEVVFTWSENGNVLSAVTSLTNKIQFSTLEGRAAGVAIWR